MFDENYNNIQNEFKNIDYNNYNANNNQSTSDIYKEFLKNQEEQSNLSKASNK
jgi:hypothetical protein